MSKQYNLSTTDDNGQSVTTSQTVTEHPEEILRLMKLAGLENAQVVAEDESVFEPTPANDKLDLDDYSKKSPESIAKQKKTIQPTLGDNPLEYSLDENEIYEAMIEEFDKPEEKLDEIIPLIPAVVKGVKAVANTAGKSMAHKKTPQVKLAGHDDPKTGSPTSAVTVDFSSPTKAAGQGPASTKFKKFAKAGRNHNDDAIAPPKGHHSNTATRWAESTEEVTEELTAGQKKLPDALQKSILAKQGKKEVKEEQIDELIKPSSVDFAKSKSIGNPMIKNRKTGSPASLEKPSILPKTAKAPRIKPITHTTRSRPSTSANTSSWSKADATNAASDEKLIKKAVNRKRNYNDDGIAPPSGHHNNTSNRWAESTEEDIEKNLKEAEDQIKALKEDCSCGHGSDCGCGPECGCGCNAVNEATWPSSVDRPHVNGSRDTEDLERIVRAYWDDLPEKLQMDLDMHFDTLKGEFDESQDRMAQESINEEEEVYFQYDDIGGNIIVNPNSTIEDQIGELLHDYYDISPMEFDVDKIEIVEPEEVNVDQANKDRLKKLAGINKDDNERRLPMGLTSYR